MKILTALLLFLFISHNSSFIIPIYAQDLNFGSTYEIKDSKAVSSDILISDKDKGITRTNISYDNRIFGVLEQEPLFVIREASGSGKPVIRIGDGTVNISNFNGDIKTGDYITTSPVSGKGMKAVLSGYVVGLALEDAKYSNKSETVDKRQVKLGTVKTALRIEYAEVSGPKNTLRFLDQLNAAFTRNIQDPEKFTNTLRYLIAGLLGLLVFVIGFFWISRTLSKSVESIGRNPLARNSIIVALVLQIFMTVLISGIGLLAVFFVIKF